MNWLFFILLIPFFSFAAPHPATSSSQLVHPKMGFYVSEHGFSIHAENTDWIHLPPKSGSHFIVSQYQSPTSDLKPSPAKITVRVDQLKSSVRLKSYVKKWVREYPHLGFQVLGTKLISHRKQKGFLIDLLHRKKKKQLRQVVFLKKKIAVIFTCNDSQETFQNSLKSCNRIIRSFKWQKPIPDLPEEVM